MLNNNPIIKRLRRSFEDLLNRGSYYPQNSVRYWQDRMLTLIFLTGVFLGVVIFIPSFIMVVLNKQWIIAVTILFVYLGEILFLVARWPSFSMRAIFAMGMFYAIGLSLLVSPGTYGLGPIWLFAFPIVAGIVYGLVPALIAIGINTVTIILTGHLYGLQMFNWPSLPNPGVLRMMVVGLNFIILNAIVTLSISWLLKGLKSAMELERFSSRRLQENRAQLIKTNEYLKEEMEERKRIEQALRLNEEKYRVLVELSSDAIFIMTVTGIILDCNASACDTFLYDREEFIGMDVRKLMHEQYADHLPDIITEEFTTGDKAIEIPHITGRGNIFEAELHTKIFEVSGEKRLLAYIRDISERRQSEENLRKSESIFRNLAEHVPGTIYMCKDEEHYNMIFLNDQIEVLTGYPKEDFLNEKISISDLFHPDDSASVYDSINQAVESREPFHLIYRIKHRDGKWCWVEEFGTGVYDEKNRNLLFLEGFIHDISDRKQAEDEIKNQAAFASNNPSPVIQASPSGAIMRFNPSAQNLFASDLRTETIFQVFPQLNDEKLDLKSPMNKIQFEEHIGDDIFLFTIKYDSITDSLYIYGIDITARKRAEDAHKIILEISEAATLIDNQKTLLEIVREKLGGLIDTSNFYVALYNAEKDVYSFPLLVNERDNLDLNDRPLKKSLTDYVRRTGRPLLLTSEVKRKLIEAGEVEQIGPSEEVWMGVPLKTSEEVCGIMAVQDYINPDKFTREDLELMTLISGPIALMIERKRTMEQKQKLQEQLEKAQRMESLGILAGGVAHDLNNMLGPLVGYPELLLLKLPEDSSLRKHVKRIGRAAADAADVIQDLLTLARRGRYEMHPININDVIDEYLDSPSFSKLRDSRPLIEVSVKLNRTTGSIQGSAPHLSKAIMNLVMNAYDAMRDGGSLKISTGSAYVEKLPYTEFHVPPGEYITLSVSDSGMGIREEELDKIFEPYYSKKKMGTSGSGLGLSVVYGIVKDHKGFYDVRSRLGKGTEFVLYLPHSSESYTVHEEQKIDLHGTEKVLVIDDVEEQRNIAKALLSSLGYEVICVSGGEEAIRYLRENSVDIAVIDMIMEPGMGGLETYREIVKLHPGQKAVIVSGFSQTEDVVKMQELGAGSYIRKPYNREAIAGAIRRELDKSPQPVI